MPVLGIIDSQKSGHLITNNFVNIASVIGNGSATALTFSSIPSGYKSLQIRGIARDVSSGSVSPGQLKITFNGDVSTANYTVHSLNANSGLGVAPSGTATGTYGYAFINAGIAGSGAGANAYAVSMIDIVDYSSTAKYKTIRSISGMEQNANGTGNDSININSNLWLSTSAITSITITVNTAFTTSSKFTLYGVS